MTQAYSLCTNTIFWNDTGLQYMHKLMFWYDRDRVNAPTQCSGTTQANRICTNTRFWYDTGLQYIHKLMFWYDRDLQ